MGTVTLLELQQQPAAVLARVEAGEPLLVVRDGRPVAELRPATDAPPAAAPPGPVRGQFVVPDDFDAPLPDDILREFEGR